MVSLLPACLFRNRTCNANLTLFAANSTPIPTYGLHSGDVDLGLRRKFRWSFVIADVPEPILGADFLMKHNLLIDLRNKQLIDSVTGWTSKGRVMQTNVHSISTISTTMSYADLLTKFVSITKPMQFTPDDNSEFSHTIVTTGPPVTERARKLFGEKATIARTEIQRLLDNGVIRPSNSAWSSPIHLTKKKRLCGDYRKLNSITVPDKYSPPLIQNLFLIMHGKKRFFND